MEKPSGVCGFLFPNQLSSEMPKGSETSGADKPEATSDCFQPVLCRRMSNTKWNLPARYQHLTPSWSQNQGLICSAVDQVSGQKVLVEKYVCPLHSVEAARATYRRVRLLTRVDHENLISLVDCFSTDSVERESSAVYLVTRSHESACDLGTVIRSQSLSDGHVCVLTYQMLRALKYLHSGGVVHGDLKPSSIVVDEDCALVLTDLGVEAYARANQTEPGSGGDPRVDLLQLLDSIRCGQAADVWSVGCIMAEMITSRTLFPGRDHVEQLERIRRTLGDTDDKTEEAGNVLRTPRWESRAFAEIFAGASAKAINLLERLLAVDRDKRITVSEALRHPYLEQYHDPDDEPTSAELVDELAVTSDSPRVWWQRTQQVVMEWRKKKLAAEENRNTSLKVTMTI